MTLCFKSRLDIQPIPNFSRLIFLAAPHRGQSLLTAGLPLAARKVIRLPGAFGGTDRCYTK